MRTLLHFFRIELQQALEGVVQRVKGKDVPTPEAPPAPLLLSQAFEKWKKQRSPRPKTVDEARKALLLFTEKHGDIALTSITKAHGIAFKDALVGDGAASGTVRKQFGLLKACLEVAAKNDHIPRNPFDGVELPNKGAKVRRRHFRVDHLHKLFADPVFTSGKQTRSSAGEAMFWLPLMALYGGARLIAAEGGGWKPREHARGRSRLRASGAAGRV